MSEFDWIAARAACTADRVFSELREAVLHDLELRLNQDPILKQSLENGECSPQKFFVRKLRSHTIVFELVGDGIHINSIHVSGEKRSILQLSVHMNELGECVMENGDKELLPWQVRRMALEETLFGDSPHR